jgi:hypothetical protein
MAPKALALEQPPKSQENEENDKWLACRANSFKKPIK